MNKSDKAPPVYGWAVKSKGGYLIPQFFNRRTDAVKHYETTWRCGWRKAKRDYQLQIVRVCLKEFGA